MDEESSLSLSALGERLKQARTARGVSQQTLGDAIGVTATVISNYEAARHDMSVSRLYDIAQALSLDLGWVVTGKVGSASLDERLRAIENKLDVLLMGRTEKGKMQGYLGVWGGTATEDETGTFEVIVALTGIGDKDHPSRVILSGRYITI